MKHYYIVIVFIICASCFDGFTNEDSNDVNKYLILANDENLLIENRLTYNEKALSQLKNQTNDSACRANLFKVANRYYNMFEYENFKNTVELVKKYSINSNDSICIAKSYLYLSDYHLTNYLNDSVLYYSTKAEKVLQKKDPFILAEINNNTAEAFFHQSEYYKAEKAVYEALRNSKHIKNINHEISNNHESLVLLGSIYLELNDFDKALDCYNKALEVIEKNENLFLPIQYSGVLNNIGAAYQKMNKNNLAIFNFEKALKRKEILKGHSLMYSILLDNLAYSRFKINKYDKIVPKLFAQSIKIKDSLKLYNALTFSKTRFSEYYLSFNDTISALKFSTEALVLAKKCDYPQILKILEQLINLNPEDAFAYSKEYIKINDSLQLAERKTRNKFARIQFETDEIELEKDAAIKQKWIIAGISGGSILVIILLFIIKIQRTRQKEMQIQQEANNEIYRLMLDQQEKIEEAQQREKNRIARDLHDGIMNKLTSTRLNLFVLNKKNDTATIQKCLPYISGIQEIEKEIRDITHNLNKGKFLEKDSFQKIIEGLFEQQQSVSWTNLHAQISDTINWELIENTKKIHIYRILQEVIHNIEKHAEAKNISIKILDEAAQLRIIIEDDGIGFDTESKNTGMGLLNIRSRVKELIGTIGIESQIGKGTKIDLSIPK